MNTHPPVVLLGTDNMTGLQAARILWRKGVPVIGVATNVKRAYCRTRSIKHTLSESAFWNDPVALLQSVSAQYNARPVVVACADEFVWWLNDHREKINKVADFLLPPHDVLELLSDKSLFYRYAMEHDLPLPATRIVTTQAELDRAAQEMRFPLILKPPRRTPEWMEISKGFKVLKVEDPDELLRIGPELIATGELILQDWVRGSEKNSRELSVCFDHQGQPLASLLLKKIRQWPPDIGISSLAVEIPPDEVVSTSLKMLQEMNYAGLGQLEFKQDEETGQLYIIEMNVGRVALNFPLCEACGMEMLYTFYCTTAGLPLPDTRVITRPGSKWICWKWDILSAYAHWRRGELTFCEWVHSLRGSKWSADVQLDDPLPLPLELLQKGVGRLMQATRRMIRVLR